MTPIATSSTRWSHPRAVPWLHAAAAAAAGAVLGQAVQAAAVFVLLGAALAAPVVLVLAALTFGGIGALATGRRRGWWFALTVLAWTPAAVGGFAIAVAQQGGEARPDRWSWWIAVVCAGACGVATLLGHAGWSRLVGVLLTIAAIVGGSVAWQRAHDAAAIEEGQERLGSTIRPEVIVLPGYVQAADPTIAGDGSDALVTPFIRHDGVVDPRGFDLVVVTARGQGPACGPDLLRVGANLTAEPEASCRLVGDGWERTSAHGVEVGRRVDGRTVRVVAPDGTPLALLHRAAASARPMDDRFYRHALLGEQGQYVRELDGDR